MTAVVVLGAGGHAKVVVATLQDLGFDISGVLDDSPSLIGSEVLGVKVLGSLAQLRGWVDPCGVIAIGSNQTRRNIAQQFCGIEWLSLVHPRAYVHPSVELGKGCIICAGAVVQPGARIGEHAIVNTGATVDHDCVIGDFAHVAPGAHLAGAVSLGAGAFMGVGSAAIPNTRIGEWAVVGAGSVVLTEVASGATVVGVPATPLQRRHNKT